MRNALLSTVAAVSLVLMAGIAHATPFTFTGSGVDTDNEPVSASAIITPGTNSLTVDLSSTITAAELRSPGQGLSDLEIVLATTPSSASLTTQAGSLINIDTSGNVTHLLGSPSHWGATLQGGTIFLATAGTGSQPAKPINMIAPTGTSYPNVNSGVSQFNPWIQGTGTFTISAPGVTPTDVVSGVTFSFGTTPETFIPGVPTPPSVPEPMSLVLLGSGLLAFGAFRLKRG